MRTVLVKIYAYCKLCLALIIRRPGSVNFSDLIRYLPDWWSSLEPDRNPLGDRRPWIAFAAVRYLETILRKDMRVYEYGSGGSTLFFAKRVKEVISTEHNKDWYGKVLQEINKSGITNCQLRLFEPGPASPPQKQDIADPDAYLSSDENYRGMSFRAYAASIDSYPDEFFDVILIDGRSRPSCFKHAEKKIKQGGYLILDNAETSYYSSIHTTAGKRKWKKFYFYGLFPYIYSYSETIVWQKVNAAQ